MTGFAVVTKSATHVKEGNEGRITHYDVFHYLTDVVLLRCNAGAS